MIRPRFWQRFENKYREAQSALRHRRPQAMRNEKPIVSFTFDDVPRSACTRGRQILEGHGIRGTYYLAMSLMDQVYMIGTAFSRSDLEHLLGAGHEIGSHTYDHLDAWSTEAGLFEASIHENQRKLSELHPGQVFRTLSYPINTPHPSIKMRAGALHACCRGGGQAFNSGTADLNLLKSYFVDARNRDQLDAIKRIIDESCDRTGWLIFSTHDIEAQPSPYGCTPELFEDVVRYAERSGADLLPVYDARVRLNGAP